MKATLTPLDVFEPMFDKLWLALGPKDRGDYADRTKVYHEVLRDLPPSALRVGFEKVTEETTMRALPAPGLIRRHAAEHERGVQSALNARARQAVEQDPSRCECGCGGRRWYEVLRDPVSKTVRYYPADVARQAASTLGATRAPGLQDALEALAGEPMLRTHRTCRRIPARPIDAPPRGADPIGTIDNTADGCPIYDPHRKVA